jgi:hypothetical protein
MVRRELKLGFREELALLIFFAKAVEISEMIPAERLARIDGASEAIAAAYRIASALGWLDQASRADGDSRPASGHHAKL